MIIIHFYFIKILFKKNAPLHTLLCHLLITIESIFTIEKYVHIINKFTSKYRNFNIVLIKFE